MNQQEIQESAARIALDHFIENVFPTLFTGNKKGNGVYKRVFALVSERRKEKRGEQNRVSDSWIESTLTEFGGTVDGQPRYKFEHIINVSILNPETSGRPSPGQ